MVKGPDFQSQFFETFGGAPKKIVYETRGDSNGPHDIVFMASLIHEARLRPRDVKLRGDRMSIPIDRDCWELGIDESLYTTPARLTFNNIKSPEWRFDFGMQFDWKEELWISALDLYWKSGDSRWIQLSGHGWSLRMAADHYEWSIKLRDLQTPTRG